MHIITRKRLLDFADKHYERAVALLDELIDEVGDDENSPLASLMETLGTLIETKHMKLAPCPNRPPIR